jgi:hypothetical protein
VRSGTFTGPEGVDLGRQALLGQRS